MLALVFAAVLPLLPDQVVAPPPAAPAPPRAAPALRSFSQLFAVPIAPGDEGKETTVETAGVRVRRKVVCGTTILIVDGKVDPKMILAPKGQDVDPRMPRVPKPLCGR